MDLEFDPLNGVRADALDLELLRKMKKAGFYEIKIGVESGDPKVFSKIDKGESLEQIKKAAQMIKK